MSASLVGSEMCIRDRSSPASWRGASRGLARARAPRAARARDSVLNRTCLLYTSDAARRYA
eukprot:12890486-Alexandrium_andersonii.AAC.1